MFRKKDSKISRWLVISALAVSVTACKDEPEVPMGPYPPGPPADGYAWREIPVIPEDLPEDQQAVTHFITVKNKKVRNFSMLYDTDEKVSYWVAYPMHPMYTSGPGKRSDVFTYDPAFPISEQMPVTGNNTYGSGWSRGHQIPSADRYVTQEANDQTFYVTNMTPQNYSLNGGEWATLESWVRMKSSAAGRSDTLYVVTGCVIRTVQDPNVSYVTKNGVKGAIPKAYYKVLLRTASGQRKFPTSEDAMCIGMWIENRTPSDGDVWQDHIKSVSDVEELTGQTFFPAISSTVKDVVSLSAWGIY